MCIEDGKQAQNICNTTETRESYCNIRLTLTGKMSFCEICAIMHPLPEQLRFSSQKRECCININEGTAQRLLMTPCLPAR